MAGMEVVEIVEIDGRDFTVYGTYADETPTGEYAFYDVYVEDRDACVLQLIDLGQPFQEQPTHHELTDLADSLFRAPAVRPLRQVNAG
jgi:hypothetical protein